MKNLKLASLLLLIFSWGTLAAEVDIISNNKKADIRFSVEILTDSSGKLPFRDILLSTKFVKAKQTVINLDVTPYVHWLKFQIKNETETENLLLEVSNPTLDIVEFYSTSEEGKIYILKSGEVQKISERKYGHQNFIFDIKIPVRSTQTFFLKVKSGDLSIIPISVGTSQTIFESQITKELIFGIYSGIIIVMFLYNLFIYFTVRDKNYLYYIAYIFFVGLTQLTLQGYTYKYLWPNSPWFANQSIILFAALAGVAVALFTRNFLQVKKHTPLLNKGLNIIIVVLLIAIPLRVLGYDNLSYKIIDNSAGAESLYALIIAIIIVNKNYRPAKFFLLAWSIFLVGVIIFVLRNFGVLPYNNFTSLIMPLGNAAEVVLLSFALADRITILKKEKEESQKQTLVALIENERIILDQKVVLETKVKERTFELETSNKNLKDTQSQLVNAEKLASLGQLTAGLAHEINNPINFVMSNIKPLKNDVEDIFSLLAKYSDITDAENLSEKLKDINDFKEKNDTAYLLTEINQLLKGIDEGAHRTVEIVKGLKTFAHLDETSLKKTNIIEGLDSTLIILNTSIVNGKIKIIKEYDNEFPKIECLSGQINQVVMNIINNAIQAMFDVKDPQKENVLTIKTYTKSNNAIIRIKDNGPGIPDKIRNRIFDPFFTTKAVGSGTGLGLSIAYTIIRDHKGEIAVESEGGKGTEFIITLPISQS